MSQLKARCIDQVLTFENTPVITSGDVNYDSIMFNFCSNWDGYTKTAIFYRSEDEVYYRLLDEANTCIIPNEVLTEKGDIYIGVFGTSGDKTLTSQVLKYKITRGAITTNLKPSDPTPDIYAQILSRYNSIIEELNRQFQKLEDLQAEYTGAVGNADTLNGHKSDYFAPNEKLLAVNGSTVLNTSILEKALTVDEGVSNFKLGRGNYTGGDLPSTQYAYGMATVFRSSVSGTTVALWCGRYNLPLAINQHNGTSWLGWDSNITESKLETILSGYISTDTFAQLNGTQTLTTSILEKANELPKGVYEFSLGRANYTGGDLPNVAYNFSTAEISSNGPTSNKTIIIRGLVSGGVMYPPVINFYNNGTWSGWKTYMMTTDGIIEGTDNKPLKVKRTGSNTNVTVQFLSAVGVLGHLGFYDIDVPIFLTSDGAINWKLLHEGNYSDYAVPKTGGNVGYLTIEGNNAHHDGNSAKVWTKEETPPDTSYLWVY